MKTLRDFWQAFGPNDLVDVAVIALLLFLILIWLRERASRSLALIAAGLGLIFLLARWMDLYLTTMAFQYGSVAILLALVVVFQQDIRHGFERLTSSSWIPGNWLANENQESSASVTVQTLGKAISQMADDHVGALIVLPGKQPLDRHLRGGVDVDAIVSQPLLLSIFHPKSPGHDGAIIVENNRISRLGLHLPLTLHTMKVADSGTRHAAALGLAENSDATVLVVSEERGTISLAREGEIRIIDAGALANVLTEYFEGEERCQTKSPSWHHRLAAPIVSIAGAIGLWFLFAYQTDVIHRTLVVPVEYRNLPDGWEIQEPKTNRAEVTLSGTENAFELLDATAATVSLEAERVNGQRLTRWQTQAHLKNIPSELIVESVSPETISVSVRRK